MPIYPFDVTRGSLQIENGLIIDPLPSVVSLKANGFSFIRELPLNAGWSILSTPEYPFGGDSANFSFMVLGVVASALKFGLISQSGNYDPHEQQRIYSIFLRQWLGEPTPSNFNGQIISYTFDWGVISSAYDPRNGSTSMHVRWSQVSS